MELCRQAWRAIAGGLGALVLFAAWPAVAAVWTPDHVVIVIEENLSPRNLVPELTYLTGLMRDNANFTNSHAIDHPSQPNYLALFSGDAQGHRVGRPNAIRDGSNPIVGGHTQVGTDDPPRRHSPRHAQSRGGADPRRPQLCRICRGSPLSRLHRRLAHRPGGKRHRLSAQAQSMGQLAGGERRRHRPQPAALHGQSAVYRLSRRRCGFCSVADGLAIVVPNQINDAHGSSAAPPGTNYGLAMDAWLRAHIEPYRHWAMTHNSLLIITWDEDEDDYTPVTDATGARIAKRYINLIPTVMAGQGVVPGRYGDGSTIFPSCGPSRISTGWRRSPAATRKLSRSSGPFRKP